MAGRVFRALRLAIGKEVPMVQVRSEYFAESAGVALAVRRGLMSIRILNQRSRAMYDTLTLTELEEMVPSDVAEGLRRF